MRSLDSTDNLEAWKEGLKPGESSQHDGEVICRKPDDMRITEDGYLVVTNEGKILYVERIDVSEEEDGIL